MWTWLAVGSAAYLAFLACVIVVLRAAKARARVERAVDAREFGAPSPLPSSPSPPAKPDPGSAAAPTTDGGPAEPRGEEEAARAHPEPGETGEPVRGCAPRPVAPPNPPTSRMRG
ncbi:hypothetical protein B4N89_28890 [Embleya scabrispora]|uniref:Uncharacterized protein n=1 Tax=Embleya scabrispora TaxID=159449 RepID=A0A1T3P5N1_9ACTN|nr:hypothetical protein [Embleya scabrispora]OPC84409.1 hypothetical protein B4N89_28890 [Embleya scabrispora]